MTRSFVVLFMLLISIPVLAGNCPNLSGTYRTDFPAAYSLVTIVQKECKGFAFKWETHWPKTGNVEYKTEDYPGDSIYRKFNDDFHVAGSTSPRALVVSWKPVDPTYGCNSVDRWMLDSKGNLVDSYDSCAQSGEATYIKQK